MWGTVINYFRFFFLPKKLGFGAFAAGKKSHSCRFQPFSSSVFLPSLSSSCSCSPVARQVRDLTLLKVFAASGLLPACSPLAVGLCGLVQVLARLGPGLLAGKRREIFGSALTLASDQATWVSKVSAASCVSPLRWNWVRVQLVLGQERRGSSRGQ